MQNEPASVAILERNTESIDLLADLVVDELAAAAGQAERERDLLLAKNLAELDRREAIHELRLQQLEQAVSARLAELKDGAPGAPGERGEPGKDAEPVELPPALVRALEDAAEALAAPLPRMDVAPVVDIAGEVARQLERVRRVTGALITRNGELALAYSDGSSERLGVVVGPPGAPGERGEPGRDGVGAKGDPGPAGRDGVSVTAAAVNRSGELMLTLSDGTVLTPGRVDNSKAA